MSPAPRVGIDLLEIDRMERALQRRPRLAERLFTDGELAYSETQARPVQHLAARFCAKEAATKALELTVFRPLEIEVESRAGGSPRLILSGAAAERADQLKLQLGCSLTHSKSMAGAVVAGGPA